MPELRENGAGPTPRVEDTTNEMVSMPSAPKAKAKAKATIKKTVTIADRQGIFPESAPTNRKAKAMAKDSKENLMIAAVRAIPQARKANKEKNQKEKETDTEGKAKDRGVGAKASGKCK